MHSVQKKRKEEDENTMIRGSEYICLVVPECYQLHLPTALCDHTLTQSEELWQGSHRIRRKPKEGKKKKKGNKNMDVNFFVIQVY